MAQLEIRYGLRWPQRGERTLLIVLDDTSLAIVLDDTEPPAWTALENAKCQHCPLDATQYPYCPLAVALVEPLRLCTDAEANDLIQVEVVLGERTLNTTTSLQRAMSSLLGLIMPCSGCPHTEYFRPMARFHLPFATPIETLYRSAGMYLLAQYFRQRAGQTPDLELKGLERLYRNLHRLNRDFAKRLKRIDDVEAAHNALIFLDLFTIALPPALQDAMKPLAGLFEAYRARPPI